MSDCEDGHFEADESILNGGGEVVGRVLAVDIRDGAEPDQDGEEEALPVGSKDDALDAKELGHGTEGLQVIGHADPEQSQSIQTNGDADVVYDAAPQISRGEAYVAFFVGASSLHDDGGDGKNGLKPGVLEDTAFDGEESMGIRDVYFGEAMVERPQMRDGCSAMHQDDKGTFATEEVDEELEEGIEGEGLAWMLSRVVLGGGGRQGKGGCTGGWLPRRHHETGLSKRQL